MFKRKEIILVSLITVAAVLISFSETIIDVLATPAGKVFPFVHNYVADYYVYLSLMRQGWEGMWLATSRFTTENFAPQFISVWLLFLGHVARWFNITLPVVYTLARISGGVVLILLTYAISAVVYPVSPLKRIVSLLLVIFGTFFWGWQNGPAVPALTHLWTELDPLVRLSYVPHHLWAKVFMTAAFFLLMLQAQKKNITGLLLIVIAVLLSGLSSPVTLATFLPAVFLWMGFETVKKLLLHRNIKNLPLLPWLVAVSAALVLSLYSRRIETGVFPWNSYAPWEEGVRYPVTLLNYLRSLGPNFILFLVAVIFSKRKSSVWLMLIAWAISGWVMVFGPGHLLPIANIRYLEGYQFIPISIIAAEGIVWLAQIFSRGKENIYRGFVSIMMILLIVYAIAGFIASLNEHFSYLANDIHDTRIYVPEERTEALTYLNTITPSGTVILAPLEISTMIPAFTGGRVIAGHALYTYQAVVKEKDLADFYNYGDPQTAAEILKKYNVSLIWAESDHLPAPEFIKVTGLTQIFSNNSATIYKINR